MVFLLRLLTRRSGGVIALSLNLIAAVFFQHGCDWSVSGEDDRMPRDNIDSADLFVINPIERNSILNQLSMLETDGVYNKNDNFVETQKAFNHLQSRPLRQLFLNNVEDMKKIGVFIGGPIFEEKRDDILFVTILDGCEKVVFEAAIPLDEIVAENDARIVWVPVEIEIEYGEYYYLEVATKYGGMDGSGGILINSDSYSFGRMFHFNEGGSFHNLGYPEKKRDVMFVIHGEASSDRSEMPAPATNILCKDKCHVIGEERVERGPEMYFNVIVQELKPDAAGGSFWDRKEELDDLKKVLAEVLKGTAETVDGGRSVGTLNTTPPFDEYIERMNFYLALEDPDADPQMNRGFFYCANIDARVIVKETAASYGAYAFSGELSLDDLSFGKGMLQHELMGHGIANLYEEYCSGKEGAVELDTPYYPNVDAIGCPEWCADHLSIDELREEMHYEDNISPCWKYSQSSCEDHESLESPHQCLWLGDLSDEAFEYYHPYECIPASIVGYSIGIDCRGNSGCYLGVPQGAAIAVNRGIPGGTIMGAGGRDSERNIQGYEHTSPIAQGFTTPIEDHVRDVMDCVFPLSCDNYPPRCIGFVNKWGNASNGFQTFAEYGNGCDGNDVRRR